MGRKELDWAYKTGAFWATGTTDIDPSHLETLKITSPEARAAFKHVQEMHRPVWDVFSSMYWADVPEPDGGLDDPTVNMIAAFDNPKSPVNRCPLPDVAPPENASFHYDDPLVQAAVLAQQHSAAVGKGSWPAGCHEDIYAGHAITFSVDRSKAPMSEEVIDKILRNCSQAYGEIGALMQEVEDPDYADINVSWRLLRGGTIGLAQFNSQSCRDTVFCYLDPGYNPSITQVSRLLLHEWGHNVNLQHTRGGVMHPSILQGFEGWERDDPSYNTLVSYFGGEPVSVVPPVTPKDPEPIPHEVVGRFEDRGSSYVITRVGQEPDEGDDNAPPINWG